MLVVWRSLGTVRAGEGSNATVTEMQSFWSRVLVLVLLSFVDPSHAYRALFLAPVASKSHKNFFSGVTQALAAAGNQVTLVTPYAPKRETPNIREVVLRDADLHDYFPNAFSGNIMAPPFIVMKGSFDVCLRTLASPEVQDLLKEEFDVVLLTSFFSDCYLSVVHQLKVPFIYVSPLGLVAPQADIAGCPTFPSFSPAPVFTFDHPMSFTQRLANTLGEVVASGVFRYLIGYVNDWTCRSRGLCPDDMPHVNDMRLNSSLVILNSVKNLESPVRPYVPGVIHAGGIHCKPAKALPQDLAQWVDESGEEGFIFFSLGSAVKPSDLPEKYRKILVSVFGSLRQRVLWKWDDDSMADLPSNVRLGKWLPQQDILSHPKLRLFITHGGLLSTLESTYHGTPVLGVPVFGDQIGNMMEVQRQGWGRTLRWGEFDEDAFRKTIYDIMGNEKMLDVVQKRSAVMRDLPLSPADEVTYWVSYIVRHKGAPHLRSPVFALRWYQLYNVDVWLAVAAAACLITYLTVCVCSYCFRSFKKVKKE
ncbi:UDP-glycosyltransferase UGT5-like [Penaeus japonicus]|uniref:UDP-glycosyltransferase UGT5-like n=1 Tax=Penaeus japonicus TaxID=27405 RepID=UPI001C713324|nr:UDP-glycosyltransferase UGT5-like [Penaeus japonicus]